MTLQRWTRLTDWPLALASIVFLGAYAWDVLGNLEKPEDYVPQLIMNIIWLMFVVDYFVSIYLAEDRKKWFFGHIPALLIVLLPVFRPLKLLKLLRVITVLHKAAGTAMRGRVTIYIVTSAALLVVVAGLAVLDAEQNAPDANITEIGDALWWAFVTISTVGYGDHYPTTGTGRLIAVTLMIAGIALLGSVTATFASWFVEQLDINARLRENEEAETKRPGHSPEDDALVSSSGS